MTARVLSCPQATRLLDETLSAALSTDDVNSMILARDSLALLASVRKGSGNAAEGCEVLLRALELQVRVPTVVLHFTCICCFSCCDFSVCAECEHLGLARVLPSLSEQDHREAAINQSRFVGDVLRVVLPLTRGGCVDEVAMALPVPVRVQTSSKSSEARPRTCASLSPRRTSRWHRLTRTRPRCTSTRPSR